jgi:ribulose-bisphosphate carboxylase large chain
MAAQRLTAVYHVRSEARMIEQRAQAIAVEQSVEMPLAAIDDQYVRDEIVGKVEGIREIGDGVFEVSVSLSAATVGGDPGQLVNMLFGNTSLHEDIALHDVALPAELTAFGGPRHGVGGLRRRVATGDRALTCSALKPQGLPAAKLADIACRFAQGGIDYIKDDHGLADQGYSPFAARVEAVMTALQGAHVHTLYAPSLSGDLDNMRRQIALAVAAGVEIVLIAPMIVGLSNFHRLVRDHPAVAFIAHPSMAGATRIAPPCLLGTLFRLLGADATIFPNHGGRFGYTPETCRAIARAAVTEWPSTRPCLPVPAGGMTTARVAEMLEFYGSEVMLLIGGGLLEARERLTEATAAFVAEVHGYGQR